MIATASDTTSLHILSLHYQVQEVREKIDFFKMSEVGC